jgi:hypothetical protein
MIQGHIQVFRRIQIMLKQKLHGTFPCLTAFTHGSRMPKKCRLLEEKSQGAPLNHSWASAESGKSGGGRTDGLERRGAQPPVAAGAWTG